MRRRCPAPQSKREITTARCSNRARDPPPPRRLAHKLRREVPEAREILRNLVVGRSVFRAPPRGWAAAGGNHQSSFGGDPGGGILSHLDAGISRGCADALSRPGPLSLPYPCPDRAPEGRQVALVAGSAPVEIRIAIAVPAAAIGTAADAGWLHGLKVVAVVVVALAVWGMARMLCPDRERATVAILTAIVAAIWPTAAGQIISIVVAGLISWRLFPPPSTPPPLHMRAPVGCRVGAAGWVIFVVLLLVLLARQGSSSQPLAVFDSFFRVGSLVFGGGHVVLPLLQAEVVGPGWVANESFVAGDGAAQAVPDCGPVSTSPSYRGHKHDVSII